MLVQCFADCPQSLAVAHRKSLQRLFSGHSLPGQIVSPELMIKRTLACMQAGGDFTPGRAWLAHCRLEDVALQQLDRLAVRQAVLKNGRPKMPGRLRHQIGPCAWFDWNRRRGLLS